MQLIKKIGLAVLLMLTGFSTFAQMQNDNGALNNTMESNGKIYVVVAVVLVILIGLFAYLIYLDRKIAKLEKEQDKK